jgi:hypothetical protein
MASTFDMDEQFILSDMNTELGATDNVVRISVNMNPGKVIECDDDADASDVDEDLPRKKKSKKSERKVVKMTIVHDGGTPLELVGRQIWRGSLLLSDFILWKQREFVHGKCIELGGGVGIVGVVLGMVLNKHGWCYTTDYDCGALKLAARNLKANNHLGFGGVYTTRDTQGDGERVRVRIYDWFKTGELHQVVQSSDINEGEAGSSGNDFDWNDEDLERMKEVECILCADCYHSIHNETFQQEGDLLYCVRKKIQFRTSNPISSSAWL